MRSLPLAMMLLRHAAALQRCTPSLRGIRRGQLRMSTTKKSVTIKRGKARLFRDGNPLVYGGAVERTTGDVRRGDAVEVVDGAGNNIGWGFYNPDSMYRVRLLPGPMQDDPMQAVRSLIETACERRSALNLPNEATSAFRLINSEGDGLSGLTVDAYGAHLVCSISAAWAEQRRPEITAALEESYSTLTNEKPQIIWRPAVARLRSEGLEVEADDDADNDAVEATESNLIYEVDVWGQKTGFYCDQRDNRNFLAPLCTGKTVLDLYCYSGGFALSAAKHGASSCIGVDSSRRAVELATRNAERNALDSVCSFVASDVSAFLNANTDEYDVVVCDPPSSRRPFAMRANLAPRCAQRRASTSGRCMGCRRLMRRSTRPMRHARTTSPIEPTESSPVASFVAMPMSVPTPMAMATDWH